jgi:hypothetical protein
MSGPSESDPERRSEWPNSRAGTERALPFWLPALLEAHKALNSPANRTQRVPLGRGSWIGLPLRWRPKPRRQG